MLASGFILVEELRTLALLISSPSIVPRVPPHTTNSASGNFRVPFEHWDTCRLTGQILSIDCHLLHYFKILKFGGFPPPVIGIILTFVTAPIKCSKYLIVLWLDKAQIVLSCLMLGPLPWREEEHVCRTFRRFGVKRGATACVDLWAPAKAAVEFLIMANVSKSFPNTRYIIMPSAYSALPPTDLFQFHFYIFLKKTCFLKVLH